MAEGFETSLNTSYYRMLILAAIFGALSSLLTAAYIKLFQQPNLVVLHLNIWPSFLLTFGGLLMGVMIKFLGRHAGLGVRRR